MKYVKKSISLQDELAKFAERQAQELARQTGARPTLSGFLARLIALEMQRVGNKKQPA